MGPGMLYMFGKIILQELRLHIVYNDLFSDNMNINFRSIHFFPLFRKKINISKTGTEVSKTVVCDHTYIPIKFHLSNSDYWLTFILAVGRNLHRNQMRLHFLVGSGLWDKHANRRISLRMRVCRCLTTAGIFLWQDNILCDS